MKEGDSPNTTESCEFLQHTAFDRKAFSNSLEGSCEGHEADSKDFFNTSKFVCIGKNRGAQFCMDKNCEKHSVVCFKENCRCKQNHEDCENMKNIKAVKKSQKLQHNDIICSNELKKQIDDIVFSVEGMVSQMQKKMEEELKFLGMSQSDKEFMSRVQNDMNSIKADDYHALQLTTKAVRKYLQNKKMNSSECLIKTSENMFRIIEETKKQCLKQFKQLEFLIKLELIQKSQSILKSSKILKKENDIRRMNQMLMQLKPLDNKLIFRGSLDGMSIEKFHSKCDNKPNLLYLVQNEFGFKYGGYSPCSISIDRQWQYETDESMSSFIFSLDANKKAKVIKKQFAIGNGYNLDQESSLVSFSHYDRFNLVIGANSLEKAENNWIKFHSTLIDSSYETSAKPPSDIQCCGKEQVQKCKLIEVEVYQLMLSEQKMGDLLNMEKKVFRPETYQ